MINAIGCLEHLELSGRIGPLVLLRCREQHGTRSAQGDQAILVKGQTFGFGVELLESGIEPMREPIVDGFDRLSDLATTGCGTTASGLVRKGDADAIIKGGRK